MVFSASLDSALAVAWVVSIWSSFGPLELENDLFVFGIAKTEKLMLPGTGDAGARKNLPNHGYKCCLLDGLWLKREFVG